jgi:acyl-CoA dehydrogenase
LERAFELAHESRPLFAKIGDAVRAGELKKARPKKVIDDALDAGVINEEEHKLLRETEEARLKVIEVDAFDLDELPVQLPGPQPAAQPVT